MLQSSTATLQVVGSCCLHQQCMQQEQALENQNESSNQFFCQVGADTTAIPGSSSGTQSSVAAAYAILAKLPSCVAACCKVRCDAAPAKASRAFKESSMASVNLPWLLKWSPSWRDEAKMSSELSAVVLCLNLSGLQVLLVHVNQHSQSVPSWRAVAKVDGPRSRSSPRTRHIGQI